MLLHEEKIFITSSIQEQHILNSFFPNKGDERTTMESGSYFGMIIDIMIVLTFFVLVLAFLYMVYSKEEKPE